MMVLMSFHLMVRQLVPHFIKEGTNWKHKTDELPEYWIYYYRSKIEDAFIRFEKWMHKSTGRIHWLSRTRANIISVYGKDESGASKIYDPENNHKIFAWYIEAQYDNTGNAIFYKYKPENADNLNPYSSYEANRIKIFLSHGFAQKYPERILYGNKQAIYFNQALPNQLEWMFEIVFDYGEFESRPYTSELPTNKWLARSDPFSTCTSGFEIRTYRLCRRILMFHHFDELFNPGSLTGIFEMIYSESELRTTLQSIKYTGVRIDLFTKKYSEKQLPELIFHYTEPEIGRVFNGVVQETNQNVPLGFNNTQLVDLFSEGIPGILSESDNAWFYKPNLGNGTFGKQEIVICKPTSISGAYALGDFDNDGNLNLFELQGRLAGFYEFDRNKETWSGFKPFLNIPQQGFAKFIDVDADGFPDLVS